MTGNALRDWLTQSRMTQTAFAARVGCPQPRVAEAVARGELEVRTHWGARFEQVIGMVEWEDRQRLGESK